MKNKYNCNIILIFFILLLLIIFIYYWQYSSLKHTESFGNEGKLSALNLSNTTLSQYEGKWGNSRLINSSNPLANQYGYIFYERGDKANTMLTWNNLPTKIDNNHFSISFWLYVNSLPTNHYHWQNIFRVQSKGTTDRMPGIWLWPAPWPFSGASLHIRQKTVSGNYSNSLNEFYDMWNGGAHDNNAMTDFGVNWQTYWAKEIEDNKIKLKVPMFCTIVCQDRKYRLYIDGELKNEYEHKYDPQLIGDQGAIITVCGDMSNEWSYFVKDFKIHNQPLQPSHVKELYKQVENESDLQSVVEMVAKKKYESNGYTYLQYKDSSPYDIPGAAYGGATLEECKEKCNDNNECAGFAYHPSSGSCFPKYNTMYPKGTIYHHPAVDLYVKNSHMN